MGSHQELIKQIESLVKEKHVKEFYCHIQFVRKIGLELSKKHSADDLVMEIACLLHDIGRKQEIGVENHAQAGVRLIRPLLGEFALSIKQKELILQCILNHGGHQKPKSEEGKIIISADAASKVLYHEAFMLLCKKDNSKDKAKWDLKYLEKGFAQVQHQDLELKTKYNHLKSVYSAINIK